MDISALEKQLAAAQEQYKQLVQRLGPGTLGEAIRAGKLVAKAQGELAEAKGEENAIPYDIGFVPEAAVSEAVVLQTEYATALTFSAVREMSDGRRTSAGYGVVRFDRCTLTKFGHPNDEALAGHPLYSKGLGAYGVYEVRNSLWSRQTVEMNRVSFPRRRTPRRSTSFSPFMTAPSNVWRVVYGRLSARSLIPRYSPR